MQRPHTSSKKIDMVITDLDRTLLNDNQSVSNEDLRTLRLLGNNNITRVIATGRSVFSLYRTLPNDLMIDYLIFSTGAGIMEWKSKNIIKTSMLNGDTVKHIAKFFTSLKLDFMIQKPIPDNHCFLYHYGSEKENPDFFKRIELYSGYTEPLNGQINSLGAASQFLVIEPSNFEKIEMIKNNLKSVSVIRATSPLDHKTLWIEILPADISKGRAAHWLCNFLGKDRNNAIGIGNDFNDIDLLEWAGHAWVVANAPAELKTRYSCSQNCNGLGFSEIIGKFFIDSE